MTETPEIRLKRLYMRSIRRGIREMDIALQAYADACLSTLDADQLDRYEALLAENDQDLLDWVLGRAAPPEVYADMVQDILVTIQGKDETT